MILVSRLGGGEFGLRLRHGLDRLVSKHLTDLGARVAGHYGIRSVCDYMADDDRKYDASFYAELERMEIALSDRMPYKLTARLFHLVAVKPEANSVAGQGDAA